MPDRRRFNLWAQHAKVGPGWILLMADLPHQFGVEELVTRQNRNRRSKQPCRFKLLPVGERPD